VPTEKLLPSYANIKKSEDLPELLLKSIQHFFEHYKDLEPGKWVKVVGWADAEAARTEITQGIKTYSEKHPG
jgi:inorganic pyrophosphatase